MALNSTQLLIILFMSMLTAMSTGFSPSLSTTKVKAFTRLGNIGSATKKRLQDSTPLILISSDNRGVISPTKQYMSERDEESNRQGWVALDIFIVVVCIWFCTLPPEFRNAKLCSAADAAVYSECMTPGQFVSGISDYYKSSTVAPKH